MDAGEGQPRADLRTRGFFWKAGLVTSIIRLVKQLLTCPCRENGAARAFSLWELVLLRLSPIMFIFQAKARPRGAPSSSPSSLKLKL